MARSVRRALAVTLSLLLASASRAADHLSAEEPHITMRVRLSTHSPVRFSLLQDAEVCAVSTVAASSGEVVALDATLAAGGPYEVSAGDLPGEIVLANTSGMWISFPQGIRIAPVDALEAAFSLGGNDYRGELEVTRARSADESAELVAVNLVDIETYVEGVLAGEVFSGWEMEALKSQAVAARTYALYRRDSNLSRGYDVDDTVSYQRYAGGHGLEAFSKAVRETSGQVITCGGALIKAHYFASGGGLTEGDEEVWPGGSDEPYLTGTKDFDDISPHYFWPSPLAVWSEDFLVRLGLDPAFPAWIEPALRSGDKILAYRVRTPGRSVVLTREQIRGKLGLKSPRFAVRLVRGDETGVLASPPGSLQRLAGPPEIAACSTARSGRDVTGYRLTLDKELLVRGRQVAGSEEMSRATLLIIDGVGYGHGVGLSQWGAQGMALMRDEAGARLFNYVDILKHYYAGIEVVGNYNLPVAAAGRDVVPAAIPDAAPSEPEEAGEL